MSAPATPDRLAPPDVGSDIRLPVALVIAVARNGVIGANGGLPWRVRADLRRFRKITLGNPVIMGRATFESIGRPLDGRDNIVLSHSMTTAPAGVTIARSAAEALGIAKAKAAARPAAEICIIGGAVVFAEFLPIAGRLHWTEIEAEPVGDVRFSTPIEGEWRETLRERLPFSEGDTAAAIYSLRERVR